MKTNSVRATAAAAGVFVTLVVCLVTLAVMSTSVNATSADANALYDEPPPSDLLKHLSHLYLSTYVLYGKGRRSERDLPVCASPAEACNLAHKRYWLTPITERQCRCTGRSECPLHFTSLNDTSSQHVSNRAQLKFCTPVMEDLPECVHGEPALKIRKKMVRKSSKPYPPSSAAKTERVNTHSTLMCRCPWPHRWVLSQTTTPSSTETFHIYTCNDLPQCKSGDICGRIRADTLESYYSCSCPEDHICIFKRPQLAEVTSQLLFEGHAYTARCIPN